MTCDPWQVVVVPFPFTDRAATKRRPAVVLGTRAFNRQGHSVLAMITSASHRPWPGDTSLTDLTSAGLTSPRLMRLKIFTLDNRFIARRIGVLSARDQGEVGAHLHDYLPGRSD